MIVSVLILVCSVVLLVYWFRYSCLLLLRNASGSYSISHDDERYSIGMVLQNLQTEPDLGKLERALDRDYNMLTYLLKHAADLELASVENRLLILDYKLMWLWFQITRTLAPAQSRKALQEMANVLQAVARTADQPEETA
jgi:hypothetical protein